MDFLRRLLRGDQRDPSPAAAPAADKETHTTAANPDRASEPSEQATRPPADLPPSTVQNGEVADAPQQAWWEESLPLAEEPASPGTDLRREPDAPDSAATLPMSSDQPARSSESPDPEASVDASAQDQEGVPEDTPGNTADTEPLPITGDASGQAVARHHEGAGPPPADTEPLPAAGVALHQDQVPQHQDEGTHTLGVGRLPTVSAHASAQGLAAAALRDVGRVRQNNQDSVFALLTTLPREGVDLPMGLFVVADGMGGHDSGEVASRLAVRTVVYEVLSQLVMPALDDNLTEALQPLLVSSVQEANRVIWDQARSMHSDMGTTCTAVLLLGHALYIAHVGDTRAYVVESSGMRALTDDHSAVGRLIQLGQLDPADAREHPLRSQLYRTIGQQPQVQVDFIYQPVSESSHLLLCSDGLWGMVSEDQLQQAITRYTWPQDACHELIALANLAGGEDNISAVVVCLPVAERSLR